jgi:hypothetical protein
VIKMERLDGGDFARDYDHQVHSQSSELSLLKLSMESVTLDLKSRFGRGTQAAGPVRPHRPQPRQGRLRMALHEVELPMGRGPLLEADTASVLAGDGL